MLAVAAYQENVAGILAIRVLFKALVYVIYFLASKKTIGDGLARVRP